MERAASVLWVDREREIHKIYEALLEALGVERFAMVLDGADAIASAQASAFDLIIVDENMGDAQTLAESIRASGGPSAKARIAIVTNDRVLAACALDRAYDCVIQQPVSARALRDEMAYAATRTQRRET